MKNVIYDATIIRAANAEDGETPHKIWLTEETNGYGIWETSCDLRGSKPVDWYYHRNEAIEAAVALADDRRARRLLVREDETRRAFLLVQAAEAPQED
jgi:hypothetical protein